MNENRPWSDDPQLTAYALGELTGDPRAAVEAALRRHPELRVTVEEIRLAAAQLESALAAEIAASPVVVQPIVNGRARGSDRVNGHAAPPSRRRAGPAEPASEREANSPYRLVSTRPAILRFPEFYYVVAAAAAACFAVLVAVHESKPPAVRTVVADARKAREILLTPSVPPLEALAAADNTAPAETPVATAVLPIADDRAASPGTLRFLAGDLSLLGQPPGSSEVPARDLLAWRNRPLRAIAEPAHALISRRAGRSAVEATVPTPVVSPVAERDVATVSNPAGPAPATKISVAPPPPAVTGPVVAGSSLRFFPSGSSLVAPERALTAAAPGAGEVVTLSAFMVTADRANGFAASSAQGSAAAGSRGRGNHDGLPAPPPGAKFGRNTEAYAYLPENEFLSAEHNPLSTFAVDVDTASYANVRRIIEQGTPPPRDAVRIEELLNYFPYHDAPPKNDLPFAAALEVAEAPWAPGHKLVRIGLKAREVTAAQRPAANLVFLLDVSGSMNQPNKLPLVKQSLRLLIGRLRPDDRVAIVTYAGHSGLALPSTPVAHSREILNALDALAPGGSTNGAMGIHLAYDVAKANFAADGINRVILCTDGDFNVGTTSEGELVRLIEQKTASGVFLTVLGFGMGNYKDATLEKLANKGNGNYGYIDTRREAEKILVEQVSGTLVTVAKDVKIQVEFNPAKVSSYRLIGYENRLLRKEDFNNDKVDAGEIGAGHTVTALYEIVPVGVDEGAARALPRVDELKYAVRGAVSSRLEMPVGRSAAHSNELLTVKVRFKKPDSVIGWPKTLEFPLVDAATPFARASADFRFAAAVAQFGMILRGSSHHGNATLGDVVSWAEASVATPADDPGGYRGEFIGLVRKTQALLQ